MRTIADIKKEMTTAFMADGTIQEMYQLSPGSAFEQQFSKVSIENLFFYIVAVSIWTLESILDVSIVQQNNFIKETKIHSTNWYSAYAKKFQFGGDLPWGEVEYDVIDEQKQIVKFASTQKIPGGLLIKVAKEENGDLAQLSTSSPDELTPFEAYIFRISAAGDNISIRNEQADDLKLHMQIFYDPLILDALGQRLGTTELPVEEALDTYVKGIDFDGMLVEQDLVDALQVVEGVSIVDVQIMETKYGNLGYSAVPPQGINPFAGYVRIDDLDITYTAI